MNHHKMLTKKAVFILKFSFKKPVSQAFENTVAQTPWLKFKNKLTDRSTD